ncbi:CueP family metal-binding protein [Arthrobacter sp. G119Y2]|uniref:CueP family metal-binding protein n=1 Tax=Arthrobacter sp. G119Y2 TaxID=3134965 RepID=UPI003119697F
MKLKRVILPVAALLLATGCSAGPDDSETNSRNLLREHGLEHASTSEVVEQLDRTNEDRSTGLSASVTYDSVILQDKGQETVLALPEDQFYLAVAPWTTTTHDCFHHSLSGCQGELTDTPVQVRITAADGTVLVDESTSTYENGFAGFWLPKDIAGSLQITSAAGTATQDFGTFEDSPTCITTMRLA